MMSLSRWIGESPREWAAHTALPRNGGGGAEEESISFSAPSSATEYSLVVSLGTASSSSSILSVKACICSALAGWYL